MRGIVSEREKKRESMFVNVCEREKESKRDSVCVSAYVEECGRARERVY